MPYRPTTVAVGWPDGEYAAEILDGETWNGHVIPRFGTAAAEASGEGCYSAVPSDDMTCLSIEPVLSNRATAL